jgi:diguanylate cyclase (GGDEF)-like protein
MQDAAGNWRWLRSYEVIFQRGADGQPSHIMGTAIDVTDRKQLELLLQETNAQLHDQAIRDGLTRLYNRRYLDETLPRELQRASRNRKSIGVIMLDIDHFKRLNDTYGHDVGDTVLRRVAKFLQNNTRSEDIACRYGGEEFTLVLPGATVEHTRQRAEALREGIARLRMSHQGRPLESITVSLGVAVFLDHGHLADELIKAADQALFQAKHHGRNRVEVR